MLGKLLKYEFQATGRLTLIFYAALVLMSAVMRLGMEIVPDHIKRHSMFIIPSAGVVTIYIILFVAAFVVTWLLIIQRFFKNLIQNEGYLMHTLPVKTWQLITSKAIAASIWAILSIIVAMISLEILFGSFMDIPDLFIQIIHGFNFNMSVLTTTSYSILTILIIIFFIVSNILILYASMAVGQTVNKHKILGSFAAYIVIRCALQVISLTFIIMIGEMSADFAFFPKDATAAIYLMLIFILLTELASCAVFFAITEYFMRKKLNLE